MDEKKIREAFEKSPIFGRRDKWNHYHDFKIGFKSALNQSEAEIERLREQIERHKGYEEDSAMDNLEKWEAFAVEIERLKCCGNCGKTQECSMNNGRRPVTTGRRSMENKELKRCPECGGSGEGISASISGFDVFVPDCSHCEGSEKVPIHITTAQYEEAAGKPLPDDFPVYQLMEITHNYEHRGYSWELVNYGFAKSAINIIVLALGPAPAPDWRPE